MIIVDLQYCVSFSCIVNWFSYTHQFSPVTQSCLTLRPHESQQARSPCPSPTPRVHPNPCRLSQWCHPAISSSVVPFSSCPQSLPASGSFQRRQLFTSGGQSIGVSASTSVLPKNIQDWFPLGSHVVHIHIFNLYQILFLYGLSKNIEWCFLFYTVDICWLSNLYTVVCVC